MAIHGWHEFVGAQMRLNLSRKILTDNSTIGELSIDGVFECYTLEDKVRQVAGQPVKNWKIQNFTAIPRGTYPIQITYSVRFGREMPLLLNVECFEGVRIHNGNTDKDTEGCILVGKIKSKDFIGNSKDAFTQLYLKIKTAIASGDSVSITIA